MAPFRIIYLLLSSLLILTSCAFHKYKKSETKRTEVLSENNLASVIPSEGAAKYKAGIDVLSNHFSGIIVLKQTEKDVRHLVFVTELGMRMLDFVVHGDSIVPEFVFDPLNKPKFVNALTNAFRDILMIDAYNKEASVKKNKEGEFYLVDTGKNNVVIVKDAANFTSLNRVFSGRKKSSRTIYASNYRSIDFRTYGLIKLKIKLEMLMEK